MQKSGFTLIELSIVLVIIGLIIGGVLGGQELVRQGELQTILSDASKYKTAINAFRLKYNALPGDMADATGYWGKDAAQCNGQSGTAATPGTCNGNGDGFIDNGSAASTTAEIFRAWQQLSLAGILPGTYTGNAGPNSVYGNDYIYGTNSPASRIAGAGWGIAYADYATTPSTNVFQRDYRRWITVGADDDVLADAPFLSSADALSLDKKADDGKPATGLIQATYVGTCTNAASNTDYTASYKLSDTSPALCAPVIKW